ncbi:MAG: AAA family ATPase [Actinobacteria bacterium]|nr:AAA family ATPase [Actinomycetota bacterium]
MSTLLERERELTEFDAIISESGAGDGRLVVIEAQAGLGKTRLLQAVREAGAHAGMRVLSARATELERDFPFALVRQLLEPPLAATTAMERDALFEGASGAARGALGLADGSSSAPAGDTFAVLYGLYWLTVALAEQEPLLLAIDDAHWADAASLDYLGFLLPRLEELPVLLVVASRPDEADAHSSLARLATDPLARRLTPRPLSREAATALLAAELGAQPEEAFAIACHEVSGGNPFYLYELARTLGEKAIVPGAGQADRVRELAPERVTRTVMLRIARLPPEARTVARALAVLGEDSDPRLVAELAGLDADAVLDCADALRAGAILDAEAPLRFIHPLVRTALYADLAAGERAGMHARAAALLRDRGADPEGIATHLMASDACEQRETVETLLAAATRALGRGAPQSAIAYLKRALTEPPPADLRAAVLQALVTASYRAVDRTVLDAIAADVFAELERDPHLLTKWAVDLAPWLWFGGRHEAGVALLERAIDAADREGDLDLAVQLEAQLIMFVQPRPTVVQERLASYRRRLKPDSRGERIAAALGARWTMVDGSAAAAVELARRALRDGKIFVDHPELLTPAQAVVALLFADQFDEAQMATDQATAASRRRGEAHAAAFCMRAWLALARGDLKAADADAHQAMDVACMRGFLAEFPLVFALLIEVLTARGELREAEATLSANGMAGPIAETQWLSTTLYARGRLRLAQGRAEQAAEDLIELRCRMERWGTIGSPMMQPGVYAAFALAALGEPERGRELAEAELVHARRWGAPSVIARALRALGATTEGASGIALLEEAVAVLEGSPARLEHALALCDVGAALRRANRRADAREPLRGALELARRCGAAGLAKRAHDELQASGEKVRRYTPFGVDSLTPSERRVAEMAASGMTNRQIAQTLFLTVKTIEAHLSAAYNKLGIRSRQQLADALRERAGDSSPVR